MAISALGVTEGSQNPSVLLSRRGIQTFRVSSNTRLWGHGGVTKSQRAVESSLNYGPFKRA